MTSITSLNWVDFVDNFDPVIMDADDNATMLYLGSMNRLYYPTTTMTIGPCRAYFRLKDGLTAGNPSGSNSVRAFLLNLDDDEATGIRALAPDYSPRAGRRGYWYALDGRRLKGRPTRRGVYLNDGKKVVIE